MSGYPEKALSAARLALAIKRQREERADAGLVDSDPIAIVGIGCRLPGNIRSAEECWRALADGVDAITEIPAERWSADEFYHPDSNAVGKTNSRWGGFIPEADRFDPVLFGISPREAASIDPQQRLLLEVVWEAIQDSGRAPESLAGSRTGVFVGIGMSDYERLAFADGTPITANTCTGAYRSVASGRLSFLLDLRGPSLSIDTACSSSLVAIHTACRSLRAGESDLALAGGVNLHLLPEHYVGLARLGMLAPDGRCKPFDARANGFVPGEGCGVVVLKRLSDALADGERVYAVIRGSAANQDGRTNSLTAPSGLSQQEVVEAALRNAQVPPSSISYVETHGTGTALGDPIEFEALAAVMGAPGDGVAECVLGAVKSNFGHLETAAGVVGLIKTALALHKQAIPANLHFEKLNPHISLGGTRFAIAAEARAWPRGQAPRFAGVSSFGFSGTNAHVVLEEAPKVPARRPKNGWESALLVVSARSRTALIDAARSYADFLNVEGSGIPLRDICHAAAIRGSHYEERLAVTGADPAGVRRLLQEFLSGGQPAGVAVGRAAGGAEPLIFVCSGQGSQWAGMGASLMRQEPVFRAAIEECDGWIRKWAGWPVTELLESADGASRLAETEYAQPAIFAVQVALARLLATWGVRPAAVIGHSVGEVAAAHIAGVLTLGEAARVVVQRGRLMQAATGHGKMLAVRLSAGAASLALGEFGGEVSIASINSPQSSVVSGSPAAIEALSAKSRAEGVGCVMMPVNYAFHSAQMEPFAKELTRTLGAVETGRARIPLISTVLGAPISGEEMDAAYWGRNVREAVMFHAGICSAQQLGGGTFVEIGPHPVLLGAIGECLGGGRRPEALIATLRKNTDGLSAMLTALGGLYAAGQAVAWEAVYGKYPPAVPLPAYPYQRQRYWVERRGVAPRKNGHPLLGEQLLSPAIRGAAFEARLDLRELPYLADHRIEGRVLMPMTAFLEMASQAGRVVNPNYTSLADVTIAAPLELTEDSACTVQVTAADGAFQIYSRAGDAWTSHVRGRFTSGSTKEEYRKKAPAGAYGETGTFYAHLRASGVEFGPAFRTIEAVQAANGVAGARVRLQGAENGHDERYRMHPALLDGCLQSAVAALPDADGLYLPIGVEEFQVFEAPHEEVWARAALLASVSADVLAADIEVRDAQGALVARLRGLKMKRRATGDAKIYSIDWRPKSRGEALKDRPRAGNWLIAGDVAADGAVVVNELRKRGANATAAGFAEPLPQLANLAGVALVGKPDVALALALIQRLLRVTGKPPELWLVTRGAVGVDPREEWSGLEQSPLWGMFRTAAREYPELRCARVDLDRSDQACGFLAEELINWDGEEETAFRADARYAPRLIRKGAGNFEAVRWAATGRGSIEKLTLTPLERRAPAAGEVEVEVEASALNFRDVLNVLGMYPGDAGNPGVEFCGRVTRLGAGVVQFQTGERVMGLGFGTMASFVTTPAALVVAAPKGWGPVQAAAAPNVFLTAWHCLKRLAALQRGERALIHSGTGGVGLAAIQVAKQAGAEIFATAGSEEKRAYLRSLGVEHVFSSRDAEFAGRIREITAGRGVDVVLNSLTGELITAGFACLAEGGRFVEIGKNGIWTKERVAALGRRAQYFVVDLAEVMERNPELIRTELAEIRDQLVSGAFQPLPVRVFDFAAAPAAFLQMAQTRHTGKLVLRHATSIHVDGDGSYLITGGLGAVGLAAAEWLADRGARTLILIGRTQPGGGAQARIEAITARGARVEVRQADVASKEQMQAVLSEIRQNMPRLAGIIHAAGVLDDGVIAQQTPERMAAAMAPKTLGAWNLHELTAPMELDFFVLCSSVASVLGSPSQAGYAAGNAFLDALAHYRRARGLAAVSISWGAWADGGMATRVEEQGRRRVLSGVRAMMAKECLRLLDQAAAGMRAQAMIADVDWAQLELASHLTESLAPGSRAVEKGGAADDVLVRLAAAPSANRRKILLDYLRGLALRILGLDAGYVFDERQPLVRMGLDSLMAIEFRNRLSAALERPLSATLLFDYPSVAALADFLQAFEKSDTAGEAGAGDDLEEEPDAVLELLAGLSDAQAEELLKQELERG